MFTSNNLIQYCINSNFHNNSIKHLKHLKNIHLTNHEMVVKIHNGDLYIIKSHHHQDELRVNFILNLIKNIVSKNKNLDCIVILNTGDGCSYKEKYSRLCFSCSYTSKHIQIPDPHIFQYSNFIDPIKTDDKIDKIIFIGSDTGILDDNLLNERIRFCQNINEQNIKHVYAKISNFVHFNKNMLNDIGINIDAIKSDFMPIEHQLAYKYILNINGNTASWDRIPWAMKSNSYLINLNSNCDEYNWYYPYISYLQCLESLSIDDIKTKKYFYDLTIKAKQQHIANIILDTNTHIEYLTQVITRYNQEYNS